MRALIRFEDVIGAVEIIYANYSDDIRTTEKRYEDTPVRGLVMQDVEGSWLWIPDVSKKDCATICKCLVVNGYCDLVNYGSANYDNSSNDVK